MSLVALLAQKADICFALPNVRFRGKADIAIALHESAIGPKPTSLAAPHLSAFGGKADMACCGNSAYDPKRTYRLALNGNFMR